MQKLIFFPLAAALSVAGLGQTAPATQGSKTPNPKTPQTTSDSSTKKAVKPAASKASAAKKKLSPNQQFVLDVVQSAVGRNITDPQEKLRVLSTAVSVVSPVSQDLAKRYANEGVQIEQRLLSTGQVPSASLMESGMVNCKSATEFVEQLAPTKVADAEQSLIGAISICPAAAQAVQSKIDQGETQGVIAPRAFMAAVEQAGAKSPWSQSRFDRVMSELPDPKDAWKEAPNYAAMYARMAPEVDKPVAQKAGIELLDWLAKLKDSPERNLGVKITTDSMEKALGKQAYQEALQSDVIAQQTARIEGPMEIERPTEENVSVLGAMDRTSEDMTDSIRGKAPTLRAKEAAASGFATGTSGNKQQASKYFDMAFSALDEAWQGQAAGSNLAPTVEEVCEAAAQVDYVDALQRAERLAYPAEQAIGMLAVARTVLGKQS
jgi:hypothetical protein